MAVDTVVPIPLSRSECLQTSYLPVETFSDLEDEENEDVAVEIDLANGLGLLCVPRIQDSNYDFLEVSPVVSTWADVANARNLASHIQSLAQFSQATEAKIVPDGMRSIPISASVAKRLEVVVVTAEVTARVDPEEILTALSPLVVTSHAVIYLKGSRLGGLLGIDAIGVLVPNGETPRREAYRAQRGVTTLTVARRLSRERLEQLSSPAPETRLGGMEEPRRALQWLLSGRERRPRRFRGALLCGPPGSGKSALLEEVSAASGCLLRRVHCPELLRAEEGETAAEVGRLFDRCVTHSREGRTLLALEAVDVLCARDAAKAHELSVLSALTAALDRLQKAASVLVVVGVANSVDDVHPSVRRAGRLDAEILLGAPSQSERVDILQELVTKFRGQEHC